MYFQNQIQDAQKNYSDSGSTSTIVSNFKYKSERVFKIQKGKNLQFYNKQMIYGQSIFHI